MASPPVILQVPVRAAPSPAPKLNLTKPNVTKELGKPTSASYVLSYTVNEIKAHVNQSPPLAPKEPVNQSPISSPNQTTAVLALLSTAPSLPAAVAPDRSPLLASNRSPSPLVTAPTHLNPNAHGFQPHAQKFQLSGTQGGEEKLASHLVSAKLASSKVRCFVKDKES